MVFELNNLLSILLFELNNLTVYFVLIQVSLEPILCIINSTFDFTLLIPYTTITYTGVLLDTPVTQNVFMAEVASQMLSNWDMFGMMVEVPAATLDAIRADCPHHSEKCFIKVFHEWQNNANKPFVWWTVVDILDQPPLNERNLANRLCEKLLDALEN